MNIKPVLVRSQACINFNKTCLTHNETSFNYRNCEANLSRGFNTWTMNSAKAKARLKQIVETLLSDNGGKVSAEEIADKTRKTLQAEVGRSKKVIAHCAAFAERRGQPLICAGAEFWNDDEDFAASFSCDSAEFVFVINVYFVS